MDTPGDETLNIPRSIWRTNFVVNTAFQIPYGGPALFLLHLRVVVKDLIPQPGQVVDTQLVLFTWHGARMEGGRKKRTLLL